MPENMGDLNMYGKFFASTFTGSMVGAGPIVFAVWGYCIANCSWGQVELNPTILATILGCSEDEVRKAIDFLASPDPKSRSKESEGRRILKVGEFAYDVPNFFKYRSLRNEEDRREYQRRYMEHYRSKKKNEPDYVKPCKHDVSSSCKQCKPQLAYTDTDTDTDTEVLKTVACADVSAPTSRGKECDADWVNSLKADPAYTGIDVDRELAKMKRWCETNRKQPSRRRFVNWLNNSERPIQTPNLLPNQPSGAELMIRQKELEQVEREMNRIRSGYDAHMPWTTDDLRRFGELKQRKNELKQFLGFRL